MSPESFTSVSCQGLVEDLAFLGSGCHVLRIVLTLPDTNLPCQAGQPAVNAPPGSVWLLPRGCTDHALWTMPLDLESISKDLIDSLTSLLI